MSRDRITDTERQTLLRCREVRDELAMKLGASLYEFERARALFTGQIDQSLREEKALARRFAEKHGRPNARINIDTGEIVGG